MSGLGEARLSLDPNNVQKVKCKTCPWRDDSPLAYLRSELMATALTESNHLCHAPQLAGQEEHSVHCRGTRDHQLEVFHRMGVLEAPTDEAWAKALQELSHE